MLNKSNQSKSLQEGKQTSVIPWGRTIIYTFKQCYTNSMLLSATYIMQIKCSPQDTDSMKQKKKKTKTKQKNKNQKK